MKLLSVCQILNALRSYRNSCWLPLPQLPLWRKYPAKSHPAFLWKFLWITSNIMKLLSVCQVLAASRSHRNCWLRLPELPLWKKYHAKSHPTFLQKFLWITSNIYLKVKIPLAENFLSYLLQITSTSVQFNVNR